MSSRRALKTATKLAKVQVANSGPYREAHSLSTYRVTAERLGEIRKAICSHFELNHNEGFDIFNIAKTHLARGVSLFNSSCFSCTAESAKLATVSFHVSQQFDAGTLYVMFTKSYRQPFSGEGCLS